MTSDFQKTVNLETVISIPGGKNIVGDKCAELSNYFKEYFYVFLSYHFEGLNFPLFSDFKNVVSSIVSKYITGEIDWSKVKVDLGSLCGAEVIELTVDLCYAIN